MNLLRYAAIAMLFVGLCACVKEVALEPTDDAVIRIASSTISTPTVGGEGGEATPEALVASAGQTRATTTPTTALKDIVFYFKNVTIQPTDMTVSTLIYGDRTGDAGGAITWTSADVPTYDKKNNSLMSYCLGCWPGKGAGVTVSGSTVQWTIDGKTDIMTTPRSGRGTYTSPNSSVLDFHHRLAALEVIVKGAHDVSGDALNALWGKISKIELANTSALATFTAANVSNSSIGVSYSTANAEVALLKGATYAEPFEPTAIPAFETTEATEALASGMLAPQTGALTLRIHTTNGAPPVDVVVQLKDGTTNKNFEMGYKHIVTLVLSAPDRKVRVENTTIAPWGVGGEDSGTVTPPLQSRTPDKGFLDWNYTGLVKSGSFDGQTYAIPVFTQSSYNSYTTTINGKLYATFAEALTERPFMVLEVAKADEVAGGNRLTWTESVAACKAKAPAGEWRLPRASELAMMYLNRTELEKTSGFTPFVNTTTSYFSGTEYDHPTRSSWAISFLSGEIESIANNNLRAVRCVRERELAPPPVPFVGDYYYTDGTFSKALDTQKTVQGMIFWVDPKNPVIFKVVAPKETKMLTWAKNTTYVVSGARDEADGRLNTEAIKAYFETNKDTEFTGESFSTAFPAAYACDNYPDDDQGTWYLPAKHELQYLYCAFNGAVPRTWYALASDAPAKDNTAQSNWNTRMTAIDPSTDALTLLRFWSSTEHSTHTGYAWNIDFSNGAMNYTVKNSGNTCYARCVQTVDMTPRAKVGDYYYTDGSFSPTLVSSKPLSGVIYYIDPANPKKFKVVSVDEWTGKRWTRTGTYVIGSAAQSDTDGRGNSTAIKTAYDNGQTSAGVQITQTTFELAFPAFATCYDYQGKGSKDTPGTWYIPAKSELQYFWCVFNGKTPISWSDGVDNAASADVAAQGVFNKYLTDAGGVAVTTYDADDLCYFFSSTEHTTNNTNAWSFNFEYGKTERILKEYPVYVRCIREVTMP